MLETLPKIDEPRAATLPEVPPSDAHRELLLELTSSLGKEVRSAEMRLDRAGTAIMQLLVRTIDVQHEARLSASFSQPAITKFAEAIQVWGHSRSLMVAGHDELYAAAGLLRTQEVAGGDILRPQA